MISFSKIETSTSRHSLMLRDDSAIANANAPH
jgi:hypothetical protein